MRFPNSEVIISQCRSFIHSRKLRRLLGHGGGVAFSATRDAQATRPNEARAWDSNWTEDLVREILSL